MMWTKENVEQELNKNGWYSSQHEILHGIQYVLVDGTPLDFYEKNGKIVVRGKDSQIRKAAEELFGGDNPKNLDQPKTPAKNRRVFIVYGHDEQSRNDLELIIRRLHLDPIILKNLPPTGETIIEKLEAMTVADFACVLLTPDDEGCSRGCRDAIVPRARQNVVLELGMVLAKLGRKNVAIFVKGREIEKPSDIAGLIYIGFENNISEGKEHFAASLQEAGFNIQIKDILS